MMASVSGRRTVTVVPRAFLAGDGHAAAQRGDVALDDVHADAAAGQVGDLVGGGEARLEDEAEDLAVGQRAAGFDQAALDCLGQDLVALQAAAVVADLDDDAAGVVVGVQRDRALRGLAARDAHVRGLDAVVDRVAHQVRQRIGDLLDDRLVELGVLAVDDELDVLAELARHVVHDALEAAEGGADLHHAQLQRAVAHLLDQVGQRGVLSCSSLLRVRRASRLAPAAAMISSPTE